MHHGFVDLYIYILRFNIFTYNNLNFNILKSLGKKYFKISIFFWLFLKAASLWYIIEKQGALHFVCSITINQSSLDVLWRLETEWKRKMGKVRRVLTSTFTSSARSPRSCTSLISSTNPSNRSFSTTYYYNPTHHFSFRTIICVFSSDSYWCAFPFPFWEIYISADLRGTSLQMEIVEEPETAELGWVIAC